MSSGPTIESYPSPRNSELVFPVLHFRRGQHRLLVILPSELGEHRSDPSQTVFPQSSRVDLWPEFDIMIFADPLLEIFPELSAGWFLHPTTDVVGEMSDLVAMEMRRRNLQAEDVVVLGAGMGAFGAFGLGVELGLPVVADGGPVHLAQVKAESLDTACGKILGGDLVSVRRSTPDRTSVLHRMIRVGTIPPFTILSAADGPHLEGNHALYRWVVSSRLTKDGTHRLVLTDQCGSDGTVSKSSLVEYLGSWSRA